jgi:hypothetical protein
MTTRRAAARLWRGKELRWSGMNIYEFTRRVRCGDRQTLFAKVFDVQFDGFMNQPQNLGPVLAHRNAAGQVGDVSPVARFTRFDDDKVSHDA